MLKIKNLYMGQTDKNAAAITELTWDYAGYSADPPDVHEVAKEMNGYDLNTGMLLSSPGALKDDGSTSCGNWLWCGMYTNEGNMMARRDVTDHSLIGLFPNWGKAWPVNRRIMYNRASVDLAGKPWDEVHPVISLDGTFVGDVPDGSTKSIDDGGEYPFLMKPEKRGYLFGPGRPDGPFPEHYEPWESPVSNPMSPQQNNPVIKSWETEDRGTTTAGYNVVATTSRLVEHLHTGAITRRLPWLLELQPGMFVEMSRELAEKEDISNGDEVIVESTRGSVRATAMVTTRLQPVQMNGSTVHYVVLPWNWGYKGLSTGDSANLLTPRIGDPNTGIPEFRGFLCKVSKA
jgi:anaerobic selenocysteine-containing dehydrogenase